MKDSVLNSMELISQFLFRGSLWGIGHNISCYSAGRWTVSTYSPKSLERRPRWSIPSTVFTSYLKRLWETCLRRRDIINSTPLHYSPYLVITKKRHTKRKYCCPLTTTRMQQNSFKTSTGRASLLLIMSSKDFSAPMSPS